MFDPITLNQILKTLTKDKVMITHFTAGVSVNSTSLTTLVNNTGPVRGRLVALIVDQKTDGNRIPDEIKITLDTSHVATSSGLAGSGTTFAPFGRVASGITNYPIVIPLGDRFKSNFKVEMKGNSQAGAFSASVVWAEEV